MLFAICVKLHTTAPKNQDTSSYDQSQQIQNEEKLGAEGLNFSLSLNLPKLSTTLKSVHTSNASQVKTSI